MQSISKAYLAPMTTYLGPCQTSMMVFFMKMGNGLLPVFYQFLLSFLFIHKIYGFNNGYEYKNFSVCYLR